MQIYPRYNITDIDSYQSIKFQQIIFFGILYTILCGILRKYFFTNIFSTALLFGQLVLPLILAWRYSKINNRFQKRYTPIIILYCFILLLMAMNPLNHTIFHGIIGFVIHAGFWCMMLVYLNIANTKINLDKLDNILIIVLIIETILTSIQYNLPPGHILNRYAAESDFVAQIGENIRVTGTFSYLGGFQALVIFYSFFAWSLLNREKYKLAVIVTLVTGYLSLLTGARNAVISFIILTIIMIYENKNTIKKHVTQIVGITSLICFLVIFTDMFKIVEKPLDNFEKRTTKLNKDGESSNRIYRQYLGAFMYHGEQPVFGAGLGSAYQGTNSVWGKSDIIKAYGYYEEEAERIVIEGGYFLYLIRIILFIIILSALQIKKISKWVLFILFVNGLLVYHTYMTLFIALGFIWVNQSKLTNLKNKKYSVPPIISYT